MDIVFPRPPREQLGADPLSEDCARHEDKRRRRPILGAMRGEIVTYARRLLGKQTNSLHLRRYCLAAQPNAAHIVIICDPIGACQRADSISACAFGSAVASAWSTLSSQTN